VSREEDWTAAVAAALGRFGKLDILVDNAGLFLGKIHSILQAGSVARSCAPQATGQPKAGFPHPPGRVLRRPGEVC
jgi:NAD(P)-dependent dehydrogenase (short-subunit alcohol dehydrogenase family)